MCGVLLKFSTSSIDEKNFRKMLQSISHRGPDNMSIKSLDYQSMYLKIGHVRLSINDLSESANQPFIDKELALIFNGEIYNFIELKKELVEKGYIFKTHTDTEVIIPSFREWGSKCFERFNGMWSIVLVNLESGEIITSRDRFGIKPLYFYKDSNTLIISSEMKPIWSDSSVNLDLNIDYFQEFLTYGNIHYRSITPFKNIFSFDNASINYINPLKESEVVTHIFYRISPQRKYLNFESVTKEFKKLLINSVKLRLRSDVEVGTALSGGVDSSSIAAISSSLILDKKKQKTFSLIYDNTHPRIDESKYVKAVTKYLGVKNFSVEPNEVDVKDDYINTIWHLETPVTSSILSAYYTYMLTSKSGVKVTLDGQGADELLGGYEYYVSEFISRLSVPLRLVYSFFFLFNGIKFKYVFKGLIGKKDLSDDFLEEAFHNNLKNLLVFCDRMSMAHSVESRLPFLDYRLVDYVFSLNVKLKFFRFWTKSILRHSMRSFLPNKILFRKNKLGWPNPNDYWFRVLHRDWATEKIEQSDILNRITIDYDKEKCFHSLLSISIWEELFWKNKK